MSVLGPSGCGKTTLLNILAGFLAPTEGQITLNGHRVTGPDAERGMVFQQGALFEWMSVRDNVSFGPRMAGKREKEWAGTVDHLLDVVGLRDFKEKAVYELSGGMQQRVALARCLANDPDVILMDEPLGALDALTRGTLQDEVRRICLTTDQTVMMITHDVDEAIYLADKIVLMTNGPQARVAEIVRNTLPRDRDRNHMHRLPGYYALRNHLMDFLVTRSATFRDEIAEGLAWDARNVPVVEPRADEGLAAEGRGPAGQTRSAAF